MSEVAPAQRFKRARPCPICGGGDNMARGKGVRCHGFLSDDGDYAHCTRPEHAGQLEQHPDSGTFAHRLRGECGCGQAHGADDGWGDPEAVYVYRARDGSVRMEVVRFTGKRFRQRRPDGNGGWIWNLRGVERVLYRLDELWAAFERGVLIVYIVEGEQDADAIWKAGGVATCNPGGAGKWRDEYAAQLPPFETAIVVADRDEKGLAHARQVAASISGTVYSVEVVQAKTGKDAHDHLAAGHGLDDFEPVPEIEENEQAERFAGLSHADVLALEFPPVRYLVDDLIPIGAVGTIAGIPETHKSFLAQAIAVRVAQGTGEILGRPVAHAARVGYFWQDDSTREEAERVKLFEQAHATPDPAALSLRWFLNEGLELPAGLSRLRATVETLQLELAILDSFYNLLPGVDLKDADAERIVALLKREIADPTGCTVLIVDHMPWATDTNRGRLRAYGGVFKNAATRFGIYIDAEGKKLYVEARGNNIRGFKKTPAYWDPDTLELRLIDTGDHDAKLEERAERVADYLEANPGPHSKTAIRKAVGGKAEITDQALELLKSRDRVKDLSHAAGTGSDTPGKAQGWIASNHAASHAPDTLSLLDGTGSDSPAAGQTTTTPVPSPIGGQGYVGTGSDDPDEDEIERLAALAEGAQPASAEPRNRVRDRNADDPLPPLLDADALRDAAASLRDFATGSES